MYIFEIMGFAYPYKTILEDFNFAETPTIPNILTYENVNVEDIFEGSLTKDGGLKGGVDEFKIRNKTFQNSP